MVMRADPRDWSMYFQRDGDFKNHQFFARDVVLTIPSEKDTDVKEIRVTDGENENIFIPEEGRYWSCIFCDLVWYYHLKSLSDIKEFAAHFFTDSFYVITHGGFITELIKCNELMIVFESRTIIYT